MSQQLIEITRNGLPECIHRGDIAVVNNKGKLLYSAGNTQKKTYLRSSEKPFQAMNVLISGASGKFHFSDAEIAVMCASHYAEKQHLTTIQNILQKIGLDKEYLLCGTDTSLNPKYALQLAWERAELNSLYSDCSGKHSGMLAVCIHKGYSIHNYLDVQHPCQKEILQILSCLCDIKKEDIITGTDGCSAPVHGMPLYNMALGYARIADASSLPETYKTAAACVFNAMTNEPFMVSGTDGFCTALIQNTNKKLIGKIGAEGVFCIGVKNKGIGIAIKIEDGSMKVIPPVAIRVLEELEIISSEEICNLLSFREPDNKNDRNITVGKIRPVFHLS